MELEEQLEKMRADWDARAKENARHFVATCKSDWDDDDFFASGERVIADHIETDLQNICQGLAPAQMRVLEIGCGAGRVTRALARKFGEVHAVDISGEMVSRARVALSGMPNACVYQNNGFDLAVIPQLPFDFAFSTIVFQHIPSLEVIERYIRDVSRLLQPGKLFKFQMQGAHGLTHESDDTWVGVGVSEEQARGMAERSGFEMRYAHGAGTQDFWLWFFKKPVE